MTQVIIVRHGQSTYNVIKRIQGSTDASRLTSKGCADAAKVGKALQGISPDTIYHSPLTRARETANIIYEQLNKSSEFQYTLQASEKLKEIHLPTWEGLLSKEAQERFPEDYRIWQERPQDLSMMVEEEGVNKEYFPVPALYEKARSFWREILPLHPQGTVLIVAHNGINRALISTALGIEPQYYQSIQQSNCCINILNISSSNISGLDSSSLKSGSLKSGELLKGVELECLNQTQHMGQILPPLRPNHRGIRLVLVRHGETDWNQQQRFQGITDTFLNEDGKLQSQKVAEFLKEESIDFALSSPLKRSWETAKIILQYHSHVNLEMQEDLREINHGVFQGKTQKEVEEEFPEMIKLWRQNPQELQVPDGENLKDVWKRVTLFWDNLIKQDLSRYVSESDEQIEENLTGLIVAHGVINQVLICHVLNLPPENLRSLRQDNGSITVIDYPLGREGLPVMQSMNITNHLA